MTNGIGTFRNGVSAAAVLALAIGLASPATAQQIIYDSIRSPLPANVPSVGFEVNRMAESGDGLVFAGSQRSITSVDVVLSVFACQHGHWEVPFGTVFPNGDGPCVTTPGTFFNQPITLNIYAVNPGTTPGALLGSVTQVFAIPYRPSSIAANDGEGWDAADDHGQAYLAIFELGSGLTVPDRAIVTIAFNTSDAGATPLRPQPCNSLPAPDNDNCPYDSLNISADVVPPGPTVGSVVDPLGIYARYNNPVIGACNPADPPNVLVEDVGPGCGPGTHPEIEVFARPADAFQVAYVANLTIGDSYINVTNAGTRGGYDAGDIFGRPFGGVCVNAYYFDPNEELLSCCSCYVSPNGLHSFSLQKDFLANLLTPGSETAGTVLLVGSSAAANGTCDTSAALWTIRGLEGGLRAWVTELHNNTSVGPTAYQMTEIRFRRVDLSESEQAKVVQLCGSIVTNGSKHGVCNSCPTSGLAAAKQ